MVAVVNSETVDSAELYSVQQTSTLPPNLASSQPYCISTLPSNFQHRHQQLKWVANCFRMINVRFFFSLYTHAILITVQPLTWRQVTLFGKTSLMFDSLSSWQKSTVVRRTRRTAKNFQRKLFPKAKRTSVSEKKATGK